MIVPRCRLEPRLLNEAQSVPLSGCDSGTHPAQILERFRCDPLGMMPPRVAEQASGDDVFIVIAAAVAAGDQMLGCGLQQVSLCINDTVNSRECTSVADPHRLFAVVI